MKIRRFIFWFHLICGLCVGSVLFIVAFTGVILSFRPQIIHFFEWKRSHVAVADSVERLGLDDLLYLASQVSPREKIIGLTVDSDRYASLYVQLNPENGFFLDPYTGKYLGKRSTIREIFNKVEDWHRYLGFQGHYRSIGHVIKKGCNVAFLLLFLAGIYLWWPKILRWPAIRNVVLFNQGAKGNAADWNRHNVVGIWCAPFLLVSALTGIVMSYGRANVFISRAIHCKELRSDRSVVSSSFDLNTGQLVVQGAYGSPLSLELLFKKVTQAVPDWKTVTLRLPINGERVNALVLQGGVYSTHLVLNAFTGDFIRSEQFTQLDPRRQTKIWIEYIHTGQAFGILGQCAMGMGTIGALYLVWTGFAMAWRRFFAKK